MRIFSPFRNIARYQLWIAYNEEYNADNQDDADNTPIIGYYCTCKVGSRTLGACVHITSVLWYLGYARHEDDLWYHSLKILRTIQNAAMDIDNEEIIEPNIEELLE